MKIIAYAATSKVHSRVELPVEIDDEDLDGLTGAERDARIQDYAREAVWNSGTVDIGWRPE